MRNDDGEIRTIVFIIIVALVILFFYAITDGAITGPIDNLY